jgi:hypothetical protein
MRPATAPPAIPPIVAVERLPSQGQREPRQHRAVLSQFAKQLLSTRRPVGSSAAARRHCVSDDGTAGLSPLSPLKTSSRNVRRDIAARSGTGPVSELNASVMYCSSVKRSIVRGIVPKSRFWSSSRYSKSVSRPISDGMLDEILPFDIAK